MMSDRHRALLGDYTKVMLGMVSENEHHRRIQGLGSFPIVASGLAVVLCRLCRYTSGDGRTGSGEWQQCQQLVARVINPKNCKAAAEAPCPEIPAHMPQLTGAW